VTAAAARFPGTAVQEALAAWAASFLTLLAAFVLVPDYAKLVATVTFLYVPLWAMDRRGEDYADYGVTLRRVKADLKMFGAFAGVVFPLFLLAFVGFFLLLPHLPPAWRAMLSPVQGPVAFRPRLPNRFGEWVVDQLFVVALPEEFFYRGFIQTRLRDAWPQGKVVFGARLGPAFWLTAVLFALGHLAVFRFWRLGVFFPALLFGWMRERSGTVVGSTLFHASANLLEKVLEACFLGIG
jgi:membrane protease YdiL (CAAX protease family)